MTALQKKPSAFAILAIGTIELGLYAFLLVSVMRPHSRTYWLVVTFSLALFALASVVMATSHPLLTLAGSLP